MKSKERFARICKLESCQKPFETSRRDQVFCHGGQCRKIFATNKNKDFNLATSTSRCTTGAISELIVCADLLKKGYSVFRALSPNCPCDLTVLLGEQVCRVEVKTGYISEHGNLVYPKPKNQVGSHDILAVVLKDGNLIYLPTIESWFTLRNKRG